MDKSQINEQWLDKNFFKDDTNQVGLNFISQFCGYYGIAIHAQKLASGLQYIFATSKYNYSADEGELYNRPILETINTLKFINDKLIFKQISPQPLENITEYITYHYQNTLCDSNNNLIFWYPDSYYRPNKNKTVGYYIFEYDIIPTSYIEFINKLDGIVTASKWGKQVLIDNGIKIPIGISQVGYNKVLLFNDNDISIIRHSDSKYRFLHFGKAERRKSTEKLIRAFNEEFKNDPNIELVLSIWNHHIPNFNPYTYIRNLNLKYGIDNIVILPDKINNYIKHFLLTKCDCAIYPSCAEGIGLPIVEAIEMKLPVITCYNSGITEYINKDENMALLIDNLEEKPVYDPYFFPNEGEYGFWLEPSINEIKKAMNYAYGNQTEMVIKSNNANNYLSKNFSWIKSAQSILDFFDEI